MNFIFVVLIFVMIFVTPVCFVVAKSNPNIRIIAVLILAALFVPMLHFAFGQGIRNGKVSLWRNLSEPTQKLLIHFDELGKQGEYIKIDEAVDRINQASAANEIDFHPNGVDDSRYVFLVDDIIEQNSKTKSKKTEPEN